MEGIAVVGFVFSGLGLIAFLRLNKLIKTLKDQGILDDSLKKMGELILSISISRVYTRDANFEEVVCVVFT